jgi:hypothetical protein
VSVEENVDVGKTDRGRMKLTAFLEKAFAKTPTPSSPILVFESLSVVSLYEKK